MKQNTPLPARLAGDAALLDSDIPETPAGGDSPGYNRVMRAMHWATTVLLLASFLAAWMIDNAANHAEAAWLVMVHRSFGVAILLLTTARLAYRQRSHIPSLPADMPTTQRLATRINVAILYTLLLAQPLLGMAASMAHGDHIVLFGNLTLPLALPVDKVLARQIFQVHSWTAKALLTLIGLHVAMALHHHFIRKDAVLARMLPGILPNGRQIGGVGRAQHGRP
jgi:cytochrome b561